MDLWLLFIVSALIGSFVTGALRYILEIKVTSKYTYGSVVFDVVNSFVFVIVVYFLASALRGYLL